MMVAGREEGLIIFENYCIQKKMVGGIGMHKRPIIIIAGNGFDPLTSWLWAQDISPVPPCSLLLGISQLYIFFKSRKLGSNGISLKLLMKPLHQLNEIDFETGKKVLQ
jgi:hypothetical protein